MSSPVGVPRRNGPRVWHPRPYGPVFALISVGIGACIETTVDLRQPATEPAPSGCADDERQNPENGLCERCLRVEDDSESDCRCASVSSPAPFPFCEGELLVECQPCEGDVTNCRDFVAETGVVLNCPEVLACCAELQEDADSTPCCPESEIAVCFTHPQIDDALALDCGVELGN